MTSAFWTSWPSWEALSREGYGRARRTVSAGMRLAGFGALLWATLSGRRVGGWEATLVLLWVAGSTAVVWGIFRATLHHRLWLSVGLFALVIAGGFAVQQAGLRTPALVVWCGCTVVSLERTPLAAAAPVTAVSLTGFVLFNDGSWMGTAGTAGGMVLAGYVMRLDAEARGTALRLLAQERAARKAEAESAALAERARIAREIHDVLAHSLSAQLVHLEAARLLIERGADREQLLDRVVGARRMAQDGLHETRHALSALRGEMSSLEDFLTGLVAAHATAEVTVTGDRRPLPADASQAVRRVAQEAVTNARKHAPGAKVVVHLAYGSDTVTLDVKDSGGTPGELAPCGELARSGGGYGLRGMRERAELLGGTLAAAPYEEGFAVTLRVPA